MKKIIHLLYVLLLALSSSCVTVNESDSYYYECVSDKGYYLYSSPNTTSAYSIYIEPGTPLYTKSSRRSRYPKFQVGTYIGYLYKPSFIRRVRSIFKVIPATLAISHDDRYFQGKHGSLYHQYSSNNSTSGNYYSGDTYVIPSSGGTVNVKGYYRKDGTYVRPHTRSAPRRH